jgi:DNA helicase IV
VAPGSTRQGEIEAEQRHVDRVYARLAQLREEAKELRSAGYRLGQERHPGALFERDVLVFQASRMLRELETEHEGLVFGRLDKVDGQAQYVGRLGVRDPDFEPLVIDWRAPAAAAFYRATPEEPMEVVRRRTIRSFGQRVTDLTDDLLMPDAAPDGMPVVGEGSLMADLSRARGPAMRDIVATIQREQDEAVRAPAGGITEITGGPGTGKTAVALHRAAYLLYADRRRFSGGVLVVGPSPVFMDYISRVLPSLGEDTVELRSLGDVLDGVTASRLDPPALAELKGSGRMRRILKAALALDPPSVPTELRIVYQGQVLRLDAATLGEIRREVHRQRVTPNRARKEAANALLNGLWRAAGDPDDPSSSPRREPLVADLADRSEFDSFLDRWWPQLRPNEVLSWLGDPARLASVAGRGLSAQQVQALSTSWREAAAGRDGEGTEPDWSVADVALLDELRVMAGERGEGRRGREFFYGHLIVDEAQDLSPMQWRMLGRRGQYASWTIVGDPAQSSWPNRDESEKARESALGKVKTRRRFQLSTNYRNSAEIFELAASVVRDEVAPMELPKPVRSTGWPPSVRTVGAAELAAACRLAVDELLDAVEGTVGVITAMHRRDEVAGWLNDQLADGTDPAQMRLRVAGSLEAKGLEYDAVVLVEPSEVVAESSTGRRALYVALTRATQRLTVLAQDDSWRG